MRDVIKGRHSRRAALTPVVVMLGAALAACGSASTANSPGTTVNSPTASSANIAPITAKFAAFGATTTPAVEAAEHFASLLKQYSNGKIQLTVYPNSELGAKAPLVLAAVENNTIQFTATAATDSIVPSTDVLLAPYLFPNQTVALSVLNGTAVRQAIWDQMQSHGLYVMGVWGQGFSDLVSTTPISTPSDYQGLKVRVFDPVIAKLQYGEVGADAVNLPVSQVFTALSTHLVQAATDPPVLLLPTKWYEEAPNLTLLNEQYITVPVEVSLKFWDGLSNAQKAIFNKAWTATLAWQGPAVAAQNSASLKTVESSSGVHVLKVDTAPFKADDMKIYPALEKEFPGVVQAVQTAVTAAGSS